LHRYNLKECIFMTNLPPAISASPRNSANAAAGIVLFAHGARDARWAEPFAKVTERVRGAAPDLAVEIAFLEFMAPDLASAVARLVSRGVARVRVIPLFLGTGGHLRAEVPRLVAEIAASRPGIAIDLAPAAGDDAKVIEALASYCLAEAAR
jgi:sirohydrochlorin cobaltochelatase